MILTFSKYQATGNDFILIDDRENIFPKGKKSLITNLCHRKFGIGSDGLILLQKSNSADFHMQYFNPDGSESLCGNGSRCAIAFAKSLAVFHENSTVFTAYDGLHKGKMKSSSIQFALSDVKDFNQTDQGYLVNTGSPHLIVPVSSIEKLDVYSQGKELRYHKDFQPLGVNINFVEFSSEHISVRTYERGVENETLSCGTGVTAACIIAAGVFNYTSPVNVLTKGGELTVSFSQLGQKHFSDVQLEGPAEKVFTGTIQINESIFN